MSEHRLWLIVVVAGLFALALTVVATIVAAPPSVPTVAEPSPAAHEAAP